MEIADNVPTLQAHFVVYYDTGTNEWQIDLDELGHCFPNGDVWLKAREEWVLPNEYASIEVVYENLRTELLNKLNNKVGN